MDWGWDLKSPQEDGPLTLNADVPWPFHKAAQITLGLDVSTCKQYEISVMNIKQVSVWDFKKLHTSFLY